MGKSSEVRRLFVADTTQASGATQDLILPSLSLVEAELRKV
jgi:hypothetical protein